MAVYRTAQEAVLDALRSGQLPEHLARIVDPQTGLVHGEYNPGHMREFDNYTGQVHYQYGLPGQNMNPGLQQVPAGNGPLPPNQRPGMMDGQEVAAFSNDPNDWKRSQQGIQPAFWSAQLMGNQTPLAQTSAPFGSYGNPISPTQNNLPMHPPGPLPIGPTSPTNTPSGAGIGGANAITSDRQRLQNTNVFGPPGGGGTPTGSPLPGNTSGGPSLNEYANIMNQFPGFTGPGGTAGQPPRLGEVLIGPDGKTPLKSNIPDKLNPRPRPETPQFGRGK